MAVRKPYITLSQMVWCKATGGLWTSGVTIHVSLSISLKDKSGFGECQGNVMSDCIVQIVTFGVLEIILLGCFSKIGLEPLSSSERKS